jgi:hypothetical protein
MRPLTVAITCLALIVGAFGLRMLVVRYSWLPVSEQAVLRHSVSVTLYYVVDGPVKPLKLNEAETAELLAALHVEREYPSYSYSYAGPAPGQSPETATVEFHFPNHSSRSYPLNGKSQLGNLFIDPAFYDKACEIASRHEKQRVEHLAGPLLPPAGGTKIGGNRKAPAGNQ